MICLHLETEFLVQHFKVTQCAFNETFKNSWTSHVE